jgi:hypothetical protein
VKAKDKGHFPLVIETFRHVGDYEIGYLKQANPSCFNGTALVERFRITIERITEQPEAVQARIIELWEACDNMHHAKPLREAAEKWGLDLTPYRLGAKRKRT